MNKYKITYNEGDHINKTMIIEADHVTEALTVFLLKNPNAVFEKVVKIGKE